jgi:hypothetical protein
MRRRAPAFDAVKRNCRRVVDSAPALSSPVLKAPTKALSTPATIKEFQ